jgi:hypothetical protein
VEFLHTTTNIFFLFKQKKKKEGKKQQDAETTKVENFRVKNTSILKIKAYFVN